MWGSAWWGRLFSLRGAFSPANFSTARTAPPS